MSKVDTPEQKKNPSGSWRVVRSVSVPASVTSVHGNEAAPLHHSGSRKIQKVEEESLHRRERQAPGYFENADPSFSKS